MKHQCFALDGKNCTTVRREANAPNRETLPLTTRESFHYFNFVL